MTRSEMLQVVIAMLGTFGSAGLGLLWRLVQGIGELNQKIAVVVERVDSHERRINRLENP